MNIKIVDGTYKIRGKDVNLAGMVFPLVEEYKVGAKGGYVTVDGRAVNGFPDRAIKIACDNAAAYEDAAGAAVADRTETDEETIDRLRERFEMLEDMTRATKKGAVRAMIVSGPPGVGKSHGVEKVLGKHEGLHGEDPRGLGDAWQALGERLRGQVIKVQVDVLLIRAGAVNLADLEGQVLRGRRVAGREGVTTVVAKDAALTAAALCQQAARR